MREREGGVSIDVSLAAGLLWRLVGLRAVGRRDKLISETPLTPDYDLRHAPRHLRRWTLRQTVTSLADDLIKLCSVVLDRSLLPSSFSLATLITAQRRLVLFIAEVRRH